jgi:signal transduction histidine kinase
MSSQANPSSGLPGGNTAAPANWLAGGGEMGERIRSKDWSQTPFGPVETWSPALRMMVPFILANRFPMLLWWGPEFRQFYNDAYRPVLGTKHPHYLGRPVSECWSEIWHILQPLIETPFRGGPATWMEDILLEINRYGLMEETHFTIAYSPVPDESAPGGIGGVLATVHEISGKVVAERRVAVLADLAARATEGRTSEQACEIAAETLAQHGRDIPFALLYLIDPDGKQARLAGAAGVAPGQPASPTAETLAEGEPALWPLREVLATESAQAVTDLGTRLGGDVPPGPWSDPPHTAMVVPIRSAKAHHLAGFLVAGVSARLPLDEQYRGFLELVASQAASAIANARAYEEERRRAEALAEIDRAKTAFFSNVSHEFRTPLTLMLGPVEELLLRSRTDLSPAAKDQLEVVNRNGLRLLRLVNTLLDFSRIEAGRVQSVFEPTDLAAFTGELASAFRAATEKAGLRLIVDCPRLPEPVYVDRDMWEKIVLNLVSNAFKFTFDGEIEVKIRVESGIAVLTVRDTGVGVPTEEIPRLFERFHRVQNTRGRTYEGSGIGLALVQELVKLHSGSIRAESVLGSGTTFFVTVPLGSEHVSPDRLCGSRNLASTAVGAAPFVEEALRWLPEGSEVEETLLPASNHELMSVTCPPGEAEHEAGRPRIIIADDNADMRQYLARLLRERYDLEAVPDGQAVLTAARERTPDLILSDVMMPNLDGFGLVRELRADSDLKTIPIILLSARAGEESRVEGLQQGADDYLIKPFSARELMARVAAHLEMARLRRDAAEQIRQSEDRLREVNAELQQRVAQEQASNVALREARRAAVNLMKDAVASRERAEQAAAELRESEEALKKAHDELEMRVKERTSELEGSNKTLVEYSKKLQKLNEELQDFAFAAAHDLQEPLRKIQTFCDMVMNRCAPVLDGTGKEYMDRVVSSAGRMRQLLRDLLEFSRVTMKVESLKEIDLGRVVREAADVFEDGVRKIGGSIEIESMPCIEADAGQMLRLFQNLIDNALKYRSDEGPRIKISAKQDGGRCEIFVEDNGIGFEQQYAEQIFKPFRRLHSRKEYEGTGVGLAICRKIAEQHGGSIRAESEPGKGSRFVVALPVKQDKLVSR